MSSSEKCRGLLVLLITVYWFGSLISRYVKASHALTTLFTAHKMADIAAEVKQQLRQFN